MILTLDFGNTFVKSAVFKDGVLKDRISFRAIDFVALEVFIQKHLPIERILICSVTSSPSRKWTQMLEKHARIEFLSPSTPLPFKIAYSPPSSLGMDRIASVAGARKIFPSSPLLIIDAGTCVKYNRVDAEGNFTGGAISPGLESRFLSLHKNTHLLPEINIPKSLVKVVGNNTTESIQSGVLNGLLFEVEGFIHHFLETEKAGKVVVTGGASPLLAAGLKNSIFASPNLVLVGLNEIFSTHTGDI